MNIIPIGDRILIKRLKEKEMTDGGIFIPDVAKEKPQQGEVIATGKGRITDHGDLIRTDVSVGDRVLFTKYSGAEIEIDGEKYLFINGDDILGSIT